MNKPPIFIIGNPRSGTTLLRLMLTCHRNIIVPPEGGFGVWLYEKYRSWSVGESAPVLGKLVADILGCRKMETWNLKANELEEFLRVRAPRSYPEAVSAVYQCYGISRKRPFTRWGDKNNFYLHHIETLNTMFPTAQFVHIVRDGRNVACSYRKLGATDHKSPYAPSLPSSIAEIATEWSENVTKIGRSLSKIDIRRVCEVRMEDLLQDPADELVHVCRQLGEEFDPAMLNYYQQNAKETLEPRELLSWKQETLNPPNPDGNRKYRTELTKDEVRTFEAVAGDTLARYGYV